MKGVRYTLKRVTQDNWRNWKNSTKNEIDFGPLFLNQETAVFSGAEKLAKKLNCPVVFAHIDKIRLGIMSDFELHKPLKYLDGEITNLHTRKLEEK